MTSQILFLLLGFALLIAGGELLVRGAVRIAERLGLSPLLIGLAVVGLGTSTPELAASVQASLAGSPGIAIGNIVGSNMANLLLILGAAALIAPIAVARGVLWRDGGVGIAAILALMAVAWTLGLDRLVGAVFLAAMAGYIYFAYRQESLGGPHGAAYDRAMAMEEFDPAFVPRVPPSGRLLTAVLLFLGGLVLVVGGGTLLVGAAIAIAESLGVSDEVIGLTVVSIGTSLPELVTSAIAAFRKEGDIALGNVLGSNLYNVLFIGGVTGLAAPTVVPPAILGFDLWVLLGVSIVAMLFAWTGGRLSRREGLILVLGYGVYVAFTAGLV